MRRAAIISLTIFVFLAIAITCLNVGCATDAAGSPEEIQRLRVNHCRTVLQPESCRVMAKRGFYQTADKCLIAMEQDGFCRRPIRSTIQEMNDCALRIGRDWTLPDECLRLRHE